jgi:hypothetical protein
VKKVSEIKGGSVRGVKSVIGWYKKMRAFDNKYFSIQVKVLIAFLLYFIVGNALYYYLFYAGYKVHFVNEVVGILRPNIDVIKVAERLDGHPVPIQGVYIYMLAISLVFIVVNISCIIRGKLDINYIVKAFWCRNLSGVSGFVLFSFGCLWIFIGMVFYLNVFSCNVAVPNYRHYGQYTSNIFAVYYALFMSVISSFYELPLGIAILLRLYKERKRH